MRDKNRLNKIYNTICRLHKDNFPDLRILQLIINFLDWQKAFYGKDGFYLEDEDFIKRFEEYVKFIKKEE